MPTVPLLGNVADLASSQTAQTTVPLMPTGSVISYAGSTAPTGWLLCDGASLSTTTYASLFAVIGYAFGGSGGSFNLPDLRGRFVRYDDNMGNHGIAGVTAAGAASRDTGRSHGSAQTQTTAKNGLTATPNFTLTGVASGVSGTVGGDGAHNHRVYVFDTGSNDVLSVGTGGGNGGWSVNTGLNAGQGNFRMMAGNDGTWSSNHSHSASGATANAQTPTIDNKTNTVAGDAETRPINIALNAIIKI